MKFIAILLTLAVERFYTGVKELRRKDVFTKYCQIARKWFGESEFYDGPVGVFLMLLPPLVIVGWIQSILSGGFWGLIGLLFAIVSLVACIGPKDLSGKIKAYVDASFRNKQEEVDELAADILQDAVPVDEGARNRKVIQAVFSQVNDWMPAVLFWFVLLGPVGAVMYRLASVIKQRCEQSRESTDFAQAVEVLYGVLVWAPARITAFAFGIMGSFIHALRSWRNAMVSSSTHWLTNDQIVVVASGLGALQLDRASPPPSNEDVKDTLDLIQRTVITWLTIVALLTLAGYVG